MAHREKEMKDKTLPARRKQEEEHEKAAGAEGGAEGIVIYSENQISVLICYIFK